MIVIVDFLSPSPASSDFDEADDLFALLDEMVR